MLIAVGQYSVKLIVVFMSLLLVSCSWFGAKKNATDNTQKFLEDAKKARQSGPLEGDVCVIDGMEYVYGRNVKYMTTPVEPVYVWARRDQYTPSLMDTLPGRVGSPTRSKELSKLEERLARLEEAMEGGGAHLVRPPQPVKDAAGKTWILYFRNDDGVKWYLAEGEVSQQPPGEVIELRRKRVFPSWALQKEIVTLDELDCREAQYRTRELRVTSWDGASQTSGKITPWAHIFSNSPEQYLMDTECK
jgi:hypothetical protein